MTQPHFIKVGCRSRVLSPSDPTASWDRQPSQKKSPVLFFFLWLWLNSQSCGATRAQPQDRAGASTLLAAGRRRAGQAAGTGERRELCPGRGRSRAAPDTPRAVTSVPKTRRDPPGTKGFAGLFMRFHKANGKVVPVGWGKPHSQHRLGADGVGSSPAEGDRGTLVGDKRDETRQRGPTVPWAASPAAWARGEGGDSAPLPRSAETPPGALRPALEPSAQDRAGAGAAGPEEAPKMIQGLGPLCWEERLGELGLLSLGRRRLRTRGNGHKLRHRKFRLNPRKNFFPLRVTEPWPRLPREAVESPSLEIFQTHLDKVLCSLL